MSEKRESTLVLDDFEIHEEDSAAFHEIMQASNVPEDDEVYEQTKEGLAFFIRQLFDKKDIGRVSKRMLDDMIMELDRVISRQMDEILHHPDFQSIEAAWRELDFLLKRTNLMENIKIEVLNVSKEDLIADFEDTVDIVNSGLYKHVYTNEFGQFGGQPFGVMVGAYDFDKSIEDTNLLANLGAVSAMSNAPFIGNVDPKFFNMKDFSSFNQMNDIAGELEGIRYKNWNNLRDSEDARNIGLAMPREPR